MIIPYFLKIRLQVFYYTWKWRKERKKEEIEYRAMLKQKELAKKARKEQLKREAELAKQYQAKEAIRKAKDLEEQKKAEKANMPSSPASGTLPQINPRYGATRVPEAPVYTGWKVGEGHYRGDYTLQVRVYRFSSWNHTHIYCLGICDYSRIANFLDL